MLTFSSTIASVFFPVFTSNRLAEHACRFSATHSFIFTVWQIHTHSLLPLDRLMGICVAADSFSPSRLFSNWFIMSSTILWLTAPADLPLGYRLMSFAHIFMPTSPHLLLLQKRHKLAQPSSLRLLPVQHSGLRQAYNYVLVVCFSYFGTIDYTIISKLNINNRISEVVLQ